MTSRNQIQRIKELEEQIARMPTYDFIELEWDDGEPWIIPVPRLTPTEQETRDLILESYSREVKDAKE